MKITINGSLELTDEQLGALYDLTGCGENASPPGFNTTSPVSVQIILGKAGLHSMVAVQNSNIAEYFSGEWRTLAQCPDCGHLWYSDQHPETAECPRCEARYTRDRGDW